MLQVGDCVCVKAEIGGPDVVSFLASRRLDLWGQAGTVTAVHPGLDRPVVVAFTNPDLPAQVRFWNYDLFRMER